MSNLSELLPAGAGAKSASFVASGTLGSGVTVALQSDGTVKAIASDATPQAVGTPVVFDASISWASATFDSNSNKVVIAYRDGGNSGYGTAIVGTVSGTSISFGTPVVFESANSSLMSATFDSIENKVVIAYRDDGNSDYGTAVVGTVSGTSISFGTPVVFESARTDYISTTFDSNSNKVVVAYQDGGNSSRGTTIVGTVSGTSISFGSAVVFNASITNFLSATFDSSSNKVVVAYRDGGNSGYGTAIVGTVSGTSISFGSAAIFESADSQDMAATFDSSENKVVITYRDVDNSNYGTAVVGTVSGTSISFGSAVVFNSASSDYISAAFDSNSNKVVIAYRDAGNSFYGTVVVGTVSGTSISFATPAAFNSLNSSYISSTFDSNSNKVVISYLAIASGTSVVFQNENTNVTDFIGITDQAIADTATGAVIVQGGVSEKLSGLTVGADYYVQNDGSLSLSSIPFDISGASYDSVSFSVSGQDSVPQGIAFNTDGTKMFVVGEAGQDVNEYSLSVGFDVSTASFVDSFSVASQDTAPQGIAFSTDGTKMFVVGDTGNDINEYTLSNGFDVSTASFVDSFSVSAQDTIPQGVVFNTDGTKMFVLGASVDGVYEYTLSNGFDVSTASFVDSFSVAPQDTNPVGIVFNTNGTKMFISGASGDDINEYTLSNGFDVSTASFVGNFSVAAQEASLRFIAFSADGTKMYTTGGTDTVHQYSTTAASITVPAGRALSATSILLEG